MKYLIIPLYMIIRGIVMSFFAAVAVVALFLGYLLWNLSLKNNPVFDPDFWVTEVDGWKCDGRPCVYLNFWHYLIMKKTYLD